MEGKEVRVLVTVVKERQHPARQNETAPTCEVNISGGMTLRITNTNGALKEKARLYRR